MKRVAIFAIALASVQQVFSQTAMTASFILDEYVTGTTPVGMKFGFTVGTTALAASGTLTLTPSVALFAASATVACEFKTSDGTTSAANVATTCATDASSPPVLTATIGGGATGNLATGTQFYLAITDNMNTLPAAAAVTIVGTATGNAASATTTVFQIIAAPTIALSPATPMTAGTAKTKLTISFTNGAKRASGQSLVLTASHAIFANPAATTGLANPSGITISSYTTGGTGTTLTLVLGADLTIGSSVSFEVAGAILGVVPSTTGAVSISLAESGGKDTKEFKATTGYGTIIAASGAGSDPVARYGDTVREFELPPHVLTKLFASPNLEIHGSVFEGGGPWEQWFDRLVLMPIQQDRYIEIQMRHDLQDRNFSKVPSSAFRTFDIKLGWGNYSDAPAHSTIIPGFKAEIPYGFLGHQVVFRKVQRHASLDFTSIGTFPRECVDIAGQWVHLYICSSPATEYYGHQRYLSLKYAHLNLAFVEIADFAKLTGLIPELWAVQPMSEATKSCVKNGTPTISKVSVEAKTEAGAFGMQFQEDQQNSTILAI